MSGFGGIGVMLIPNDMMYALVSENAEYGFEGTLAEFVRLRLFCGLPRTAYRSILCNHFGTHYDILHNCRHPDAC